MPFAAKFDFRHALGVLNILRTSLIIDSFNDVLHLWVIPWIVGGLGGQLKWFAFGGRDWLFYILGTTIDDFSFGTINDDEFSFFLIIFILDDGVDIACSGIEEGGVESEDGDFGWSLFRMFLKYAEFCFFMHRFEYLLLITKQ